MQRPFHDHIAVAGDVAGKEHVATVGRKARVHVQLLDLHRRVVAAQRARFAIAVAIPLPQTHDFTAVADDEFGRVGVDMSGFAGETHLDMIRIIVACVA